MSFSNNVFDLQLTIEKELKPKQKKQTPTEYVKQTAANIAISLLKKYDISLKGQRISR
jgi:hypothetical protein